ncbi:MAG: 50S ribosomal protein L20 [Patescibacteria group bacterium]
MTKVKRAKIALKRRRKVLRQTKGFRWQRKSKERAAKEALLHAGHHAFADRKKKKSNFRALWQIKINAASRQEGVPYSVLTNKLKVAGIALNRKVLAELAENHNTVFKKIVAAVK